MFGCVRLYSCLADIMWSRGAGSQSSSPDCLLLDPKMEVYVIVLKLEVYQEPGVSVKTPRLCEGKPLFSFL